MSDPMNPDIANAPGQRVQGGRAFGVADPATAVCGCSSCWWNRDIEEMRKRLGKNIEVLGGPRECLRKKPDGG